MVKEIVAFLINQYSAVIETKVEVLVYAMFLRLLRPVNVNLAFYTSHCNTATPAWSWGFNVLFVLTCVWLDVLQKRGDGVTTMQLRPMVPGGPPPRVVSRSEIALLHSVFHCQ